MVSPGDMRARKTAWFAWRAGMGLHVGEAAAEEGFGALDGEALGDVDLFAAAVVAAAGIALGVFVGQDAALGFEHRGRDDVLAGDEFDAVLLAALFAGDGGGKFGVGVREAGGEEARGGGHRGGFIVSRGVLRGCSWTLTDGRTKRSVRLGQAAGAEVRGQSL